MLALVHVQRLLSQPQSMTVLLLQNPNFIISKLRIILYLQGVKHTNRT